MERYGSDKPDTRFGYELTNISDVVANCGFGVFANATKDGMSVRGINVKGKAEDFSKKQIG
ncbi:Asp-tRNA(Asn)/Glu-tRNA(Gln) amidotransferase GatCAB subunit C, partial [Faecalibacillus intestinalis]|nr:Asp-tRNA(Asn)/Glu-tRNA(Gln) amidotransferase GatCAB subunit C [Faecalibacillus intestinalis]